LCCTSSFSQCPTNDDTEVEINVNGSSTEVVVKFDKAYENIEELQIIKFGQGTINSAVVRRKNKKEFVIESLESGEYMIQIIGSDCTAIVGTDKDYQGFIIK